jgi:hypothetical protein
MIWLIAVGGGMGVLLGLLTLQVYAIAFASVALVLLGLAIVPFAQWSLLLTVAFMFGLVSALQCGYLIGVALSLRANASKAANTILKSSHMDQ